VIQAIDAVLQPPVTILLDQADAKTTERYIGANKKKRLMKIVDARKVNAPPKPKEPKSKRSQGRR